jgi:NAD+ synthase
MRLEEEKSSQAGRVLAHEIGHWIARQVSIAGAKGAVFGMSGGLDSSVIGILCKRALGDRVLGLIMPCHSDPADEAHARLVADLFDITTDKIDLGQVFDLFVSLLPRDGLLSVANLKPRLRMTTLYYFSNRLDYLVVGTGNKSELMTGYFTKHGDGAVDILPLGGLLKTQVRRLAEGLGVPEEIIAKPPSAGLWAGQTDEGELAITYDELDRALRAVESDETARQDDEILARVREMVSESQHKRAPVPIYDPFEPQVGPS